VRKTKVGEGETNVPHDYVSVSSCIAQCPQLSSRFPVVSAGGLHGGLCCCQQVHTPLKYLAVPDRLQAAGMNNTYPERLLSLNVDICNKDTNI